MTEWIKENILTIIVSLVGAGGWLGFALNKYSEAKKDKAQSLKELKKENKELQDIINKYKAVEISESAIDKTQGTIYYENFEGGRKRTICCYCWEKEHLKIPLKPFLEYNEETRQNEYWARCQNCGKSCTFFNEDNDGDTDDSEVVEDLPF